MRISVVIFAVATGIVVASTTPAGADHMAWSGNGEFGADPFGHTWFLNTTLPLDADAWGVPGLGLGSITYCPIGSCSRATDFHIIFDLPPGITIRSTEPISPFGYEETTRFSNLADGVLWARTISGNQVDFFAPTAEAALNIGEEFFVNVIFNVRIASSEFFFRAEWTHVSEPITSSAFGLGLAGLGIARRKRTA